MPINELPARGLFQKKPLGRRRHLANSPLWAVRLVPLRLERSGSAASLEYFLPCEPLAKICPLLTDKFYYFTCLPRKEHNILYDKILLCIKVH